MRKKPKLALVALGKCGLGPMSLEVQLSMCLRLSLEESWMWEHYPQLTILLLLEVALKEVLHVVVVLGGLRGVWVEVILGV